MRSRAVAAAIWIARAVGRLPGVDRFYDRRHTWGEGIRGKLLSERRRTSGGLSPMEHPRRGR